MDGLECVEIKFSQLNNEMRLDAEYFHKSNLSMQRLIESKPHIHIGDIDVGTVTDGIHTSIDYDENGYINLISATSPRENVFNLSRSAFISEKAHRANPRTALKERDVILSTVGTIGNCAVVDNTMLPANSDRHVGIIRLTDKLNPYLLSTFLLSKYGRNQTVRETTGNVQPNLFLYKIREISVPIFSDDFQKRIESAVVYALSLLKRNQKIYNEAEALLEKEIGIDMSSIQDGGISVKSFSECFLIQNRIDSEFYQPKFDRIIDAIIKYDSTAKTIDEIAEYVFTGECAEEYFKYEPGLLHYVRGTDINNGLVNVDLEHAVESDKHSKFVSEGDIVTGRVGTIGNFGVVSNELDGSVCSDNVLCFHLPKNYKPNVYALYFNSQAIKELTNRMSKGSVQQRLNQETLRELMVPYIDLEIQKTIDKKIVASFKLKKKSEQLLEDAKTAVELAIEESEDTAISWLNKKISELTKEDEIHE